MSFNRTRRRAYIKLAPASMSEREVKKIAAEHLRPMNQGLESLGSDGTTTVGLELWAN